MFLSKILLSKKKFHLIYLILSISFNSIISMNFKRRKIISAKIFTNVVHVLRDLLST